MRVASTSSIYSLCCRPSLKIDGDVSKFEPKISGIRQHFVLRKPGSRINTSETDTFQHSLLFFSFFFPSHLFSSPFYSLSLLVVTQIGVPGFHSRLFFPPTHCGSCLAFFSREEFSSFFPRRLASDCAYPR